MSYDLSTVFPTLLKNNGIQSKTPYVTSSLLSTLVPETGTGVATITRATTALVPDFQGVYRTAKSGESRFMGARRVENEATSSEDIAASVWGKTGLTVNSKAITPPSPYTKCDKLVETTANSSHSFSRTMTGLAGIPVTFSESFKAAGRTSVLMRLTGGGGGDVKFNLSAGTYTIVSGSPSASIVAEADGFYRCSITGTPTTTASLNMVVFIYNDAGLTTYAGDGASGVYTTGISFTKTPAPVEYVSNGVIRRNMLTYTSQFDNAVWTKASLTITANADGAADKVVANTGVATQHRLSQQYLSGTASLNFTYTVLAKQGGLTKLKLLLNNNGGSNYFYAVFDLANGTVSSSGILGGGVLTTTEITANGDGYYICSITGIPSASYAAVIGQIYLCDASDNDTFSGDGVSGVYMKSAQLEWGVTRTAPQEVTDGSAIDFNNYHGAAVDGVKYFTTDYSGAAISSSILKGFGRGGARTNNALWSRDLTNAAWVKTNITAAETATGINGETNAASNLTATGANGTCLQTVVLASSDRVFQPFIRRVTGTGAISITTDGVTYTDITSQINSTTYTQVSVSATVANPVFGVKIATSGDSIDIDMADNQGGTFASSPIPTTTASASRNTDVLSYNVSDVGMPQSGTVYFEFSPSTAVAYTSYLLGSYVDANNSFGVFLDGTNLTVRKRVGGANTDYSIPLAYVAGTFYKLAVKWDNGDTSVFLNGSGVPVGYFASTIQIGTDGNGANPFFGSIRNLKFYPLLSDKESAALTA